MVKVGSKFSFAAFVCLLALSLGCNGELKLADNYLNIFYKINPTNDDLDHGHFFDTLNSLNLTPESSPDSVLNQLKKLESEQTNEFAQKSLKDLISLANESLDLCPKGLVSTFYRAVKVLTSTKAIKSQQVLLAYLEHFGRGKFEQCAQEAIKTLRVLLHWKTLYGAKEPKKFFKKMVYLEHNAKIDQLYDKLKVFHPTIDNMNVEGLASIRDGDEQEEAAFERIDNKFDERCNFILRDSRHHLDLVNLASGLNSDKDYFGPDDVELRNLNEINRICIERRRNFGSFIGNLKSQTIEWIQNRSH